MASSAKNDDEMRPEYDFRAMRGVVRNSQADCVGDRMSIMRVSP